MPSGFWRGHPLAAADALQRAEDGLAAGAVPLEQRLALAAGLDDAEEQMLGRDVLVAQPAGLRLGELHDALRARIERQRAALDAGALAEDRRRAPRGTPGRSTPSRRSVSAGTPSSGSTSAASRCSASRTGLCEPLGERLGGDDGLLGLLGVSIELHGVLLPVARGQASRGSGCSTRSMNVRAAAAASSARSVGQDDAGPGERSPDPSPRRRGMPWPLSRKRCAGLRAGRDLQQHLPLSVATGTSPPSRASPRVMGSSRSRSAPRAREHRMRADPDDDDEVAAARRPGRSA